MITILCRIVMAIGLVGMYASAHGGLATLNATWRRLANPTAISIICVVFCVAAGVWYGLANGSRQRPHDVFICGTHTHKPWVANGRSVQLPNGHRAILQLIDSKWVKIREEE
ncbi:MAG TPA: hypothetical protein V6C97_28745 [Oculatellaceae cyanobacterium]